MGCCQTPPSSRALDQLFSEYADHTALNSTPQSEAMDRNMFELIKRKNSDDGMEDLDIV